MISFVVDILPAVIGRDVEKFGIFETKNSKRIVNKSRYKTAHHGPVTFETIKPSKRNSVIKPHKSKINKIMISRTVVFKNPLNNNLTVKSLNKSMKRFMPS